MTDFNKIDDAFREHQHEWDAAPSNNAWDRLTDRLDDHHLAKARKRKLTIRWSAAASIFVLLGLSTIFITNNLHSPGELAKTEQVSFPESEAVTEAAPEVIPGDLGERKDQSIKAVADKTYKEKRSISTTDKFDETNSKDESPELEVGSGTITVHNNATYVVATDQTDLANQSFDFRLKDNLPGEFVEAEEALEAETYNWYAESSAGTEEGIDANGNINAEGANGLAVTTEEQTLDQDGIADTISLSFADEATYLIDNISAMNSVSKAVAKEEFSTDKDLDKGKANGSGAIDTENGYFAEEDGDQLPATVHANTRNISFEKARHQRKSEQDFHCRTYCQNNDF